MKMIRIYFPLLIWMLAACKTDNLSVHEYKKWMSNKDNGMYKNSQIQAFQIACMYKPIDWLSIRQIERSKLSFEKFDSVKNELKGLQYFTLKISNEKNPELIAYQADDPATYQTNFNYYTGGMKNDICLVENNDTLPCILFHFERNYGASPVNIFDLAFKNNSSAFVSDKQLIVNGRYLGMGIVKFKFIKEDLIDIPTLKLNGHD